MRFFKNILAFIRILTAIVLCSGIVFINLSTLAHFQHHHQLNKTSCSEDLEKDACHLFEVHSIKSEYCNGNHKHIKAKGEECFACTYYKQRYHDLLLIYNNYKVTCIHTDNEIQVVKSCICFNYCLTNYLRGPPATT